MGHVRRFTLFAVFGLLTLVVAAPAFASDPAPVNPSSQRREAVQAPEGTAARVIVKLRRDVTPSSVSALARRMDARVVRRIPTPPPTDNDLVVLTAQEGSSSALAEELNDDPRVLYAEPDHILRAFETTPDDQYYEDYQWALPRISAPAAWDITTGDSSVIVAVIDTGVDYTHPDLIGNRWQNPGETPGNGLDDDGNGYVDDVLGVDRAERDNNPMDEDGHGTHVAGTIAAVGNNGVGVTGVAWNAQIMALRFLDDEGVGFTSDAIDCINYATWQKTEGGQNVVAINASWGGGDSSSLLKNAIDAAGAAGIVFVAAAGNDGTDNDITRVYPAAFTSPTIISVLATNASDGMPAFSNWGRTSVDIGAPGWYILSAFPVDLTPPSQVPYMYMNGTSMAVPHVTGAVALAAVAEPEDTVEERVARILWSADEVPGLVGNSVTGGRLNLNVPLRDDELPGMRLGPSPRTGSLNAATDLRDVYRIKLNAGDQLTLTLNGGVGTDFEVAVLSQDGAVLQETSGSSYPKTLDFTSVAAGTFSVRVQAQSGTGTYSLTHAAKYKSDVTPPKTTIAGAKSSWVKKPVTVTFRATDAGSGVAYVRYKIDGATYRYGAKAVVKGNKDHTVSFYAVDKAGNVEKARTVHVRIDSGRPVPTAVAKVTVTKGRKVTMRYRIKDVTPRAVVTIRVYKGSSLKKVLKLGSRPTGKTLGHKWTCSLPRGSYTWKVYATDQAGNTQSKAAAKGLVVR